MKWVKRLFYTLVVLIVIALGLGVAAYVMYKTNPDLRTFNFDGGKLEATARRIEDKLLAFRQWAGDQNRAERIANSGRPRVPTDPTQPPAERISLSLTNRLLENFARVLSPLL